jgi:hypothetical protein
MAAVPLEGPNAGWINNALESAIEKYGAPKHIISVYETYRSCLTKGKQYEIEINIPRVCNYCKDITNCKMADILVKYDLSCSPMKSKKSR